MLSSAFIRYGGQHASSRMTPAVCMSIRRLDPLEAKMAQKRAETADQPKESPADQRVTYSMTDDFKQNVQDKRFQGAADAESGQVPTKMQKRFLVITRLYPSMDTIPKYVHHGTMNRMHDRIRVLFITVIITLALSTIVLGEISPAGRIARDPEAGVIVKKK